MFRSNCGLSEVSQRYQLHPKTRFIIGSIRWPATVSRKNTSCSTSTRAISRRSRTQSCISSCFAKTAASSYSTEFWLSSLPAKYIGMNQPEIKHARPRVRPIVQNIFSRTKFGLDPTFSSHSPTRLRWSHSSPSICFIRSFSGDPFRLFQCPRYA